MGNTRNTGYLQNAIKVSDAGAITFVSGSTTLATLSTTGQLSGSAPVLFAATSSFANAFTVAGNLTAQTLVVQTITSSVDFVTGSTRFGSTLANTHVFSGSVTMNPNGLFVSSSGNVGIGTTSPSTLLDLRLAATDNVTGSVSSSYAVASFIVSGSGGGQRGLQVGGPTGGITSPIFLKVFGTTQRFAVLNESNIENFTITSAGNVGIGVTNPTNPLLVAGTGVGAAGLIGMRGTNAHLGFQDASSIFKGWVGYFNLSLHGNDVDLNIKTGYKEASNIRFGVTGDSGEAMRISSNGNVLVGDTTNVSYNPTFFVKNKNGAVANIAGWNFGGTSTSNDSNNNLINVGAYYNGSSMVATNATATGYQQYSGIHVFYTDSGLTPGSTYSNTERLRIDNSGNILIAGGNTSGQSAVSTCTALRFPNQYSNGYTDAGVKLFIFNSGGTIQGFTAGPAYDLQYHSSGDNTNGKHAWYVGNVQVMRVQSTSGNVTILGSLSKGSGSFKIKHPLASKKDTHQLVHSFIEGPQADLIYSGGVTLVNGRATINIDEAATMTEGTFEALCRNIRVFTSNETSWDNVRGKVEGNILTIECQNTESTDEVSWLVIGERQDEHMFETEWTDENGKVIVEPLIPVDPEVTSYD